MLENHILSLTIAIGKKTPARVFQHFVDCDPRLSFRRHRIKA
jgi:hypothetical protein